MIQSDNAMIPYSKEYWLDLRLIQSAPTEAMIRIHTRIFNIRGNRFAFLFNS